MKEITIPLPKKLFLVQSYVIFQFGEQTTAETEFMVRCDADKHWRPVLLHNPYPDPPQMPRCIGNNLYKKFSLFKYCKKIL